MEQFKDGTAASISKRQKSHGGGGGGGGGEGKRQRVSTEVIGIGRLPDAMLCHILSFLETKPAVRTSVLSKRWRHVWTSVPCIELWCNKDALNRKIPFVERVLRLNTVSCLRKLRLSWDIDCKRLEEWIGIFMNRDIEEVVLQFWGKQKCVTLPTSSIFTCKKLVILKLNERILVNVPSSVNLPSLKILHISVSELFDEHSMKNLLDGCPVIEELDIKCEEDYNVKTLFVRSSSLKRLKMLAGKYNLLSDLRIVLDLPNVVRLDLGDYGNAQYDINSLSSLAHVELSMSHSATLFEILGKFSNTEYMCISSETRKPLEDQPLNNNFPMFHNLTHLRVRIWDPSLPVLSSLLECSPNLLTFVYSVCHKASHQQHPQFKAPNSLMLYLEEIKLINLKGFADEMEMVRYFLKNSMVLKKLSIQAALGVKKQLEMSKKLLSFPRGSSKCEIIFDSSLSRFLIDSLS